MQRQHSCRVSRQQFKVQTKDDSNNLSNDELVIIDMKILHGDFKV